MNKRYEEGRKPFFSNPGEKKRKQYVWAKNEEGEEYLQETEDIDIQAEIESYSAECDIKNIVRKASFDPEFLKSLSQGTMDGVEMDVTNWPQNIHEYHQMIATAQANVMKLKELENKAQEEAKEEKAEGGGKEE
jgi:isopenicillin N synthase-like dioxygenase